MSRSKKPSTQTLTRAKKALFYVLMFASVLFVCELGVRVFFSTRVGPRVMAYGTRHYRTPVAEDMTAEEHANQKQGYSKYFLKETRTCNDCLGSAVFPVTINSDGFRGLEITKEEKAGVTRVVTLGASSTFGYCSRDNETYPYYLERKLNQAALPGESFEVINLGIPHQRSWHVLAILEQEALALDPDVVTFYGGANDSSSPPQRGKLPPIKQAYRWVRVFLREHFMTVAFAESALEKDVDTGTQRSLDSNLKGKGKKFVENVAAMDRVCRENGIIFIIAKQQLVSRSIEDVKGITYAEEVEFIRNKWKESGEITFRELCLLTHNELIHELESWALSNGVRYADVAGALDYDRDTLRGWVHLGARGNEMIADALAPVVLDALREESP